MRKYILGIALAAALMCGTKSYAQYNREYFFWVGRSCMMNNDYQEAIRTLNTLLRFDENAFEGYFLRGIAKYNLDDLLGAEADFSTAIRMNPVYTQAYTYRAITRSRLGNYDDALQDFREAIELRPDLPGPYYSRGVTRLLNQQFTGEQGRRRLYLPRPELPAPQGHGPRLRQFQHRHPHEPREPRRVQPPRWALHGTETLCGSRS